MILEGPAALVTGGDSGIGAQVSGDGFCLDGRGRAVTLAA
jgi:NAD(P)-dependent dehydrogenase (short-subunit alcohol dehydrogenase family)